MSGEGAIAVLSLIWLGVLAYAQYRVNLKLTQIHRQLVWFTQATESHTASIAHLQRLRMGLPTH